MVNHYFSQKDALFRGVAECVETSFTRTNDSEKRETFAVQRNKTDLFFSAKWFSFHTGTTSHNRTTWVWGICTRTMPAITRQPCLLSVEMKVQEILQVSLQCTQVIRVCCRSAQTFWCGSCSEIKSKVWDPAEAGEPGMAILYFHAGERTNVAFPYATYVEVDSNLVWHFKSYFTPKYHTETPRSSDTNGMPVRYWTWRMACFHSRRTWWSSVSRCRRQVSV